MLAFCLRLACVFDKYGAALLIYGKTGSIRNRIINPAPTLADWLSIHSFKNDSQNSEGSDL